MIINTKKHTNQIGQNQTPWVQSKTKTRTPNIIFSGQCEREFAEYERCLERYLVHCFAIIRGGIDKTNSYQLLSAWLATREQAQAFLALSKAQYPFGYIARHEMYFTSKNEESI
jgi:hypothetical protein